MKLFSALDLARSLPYAALVDAIDAAFRGGVTVPVRAHHNIPVIDGQDSTMLLMPAWSDDGFTGVKTVIVAPENAGKIVAGSAGDLSVVPTRYRRAAGAAGWARADSPSDSLRLGTGGAVSGT
ncbi:MAG: hypothetical protein WD075_05340 [Rhodospirillales bacterium]